MNKEELQKYKDELQMPAHVSEIKGTFKEQIRQKALLVEKFGLEAWTQLITASSNTTKL